MKSRNNFWGRGSGHSIGRLSRNVGYVNKSPILGMAMH